MPKLAPKVRTREQTRERKAEAAAKVERAVERELLERLRSGAYGEEKPLNVEEGIWNKVLQGLEREGEGVRDEDLDEGEEIEESEDGQEVEFVEDVEGESELGDLEEWEEWAEGGEAVGSCESEVESLEEDFTGTGKEAAAGGKRKMGDEKPKARKKGRKLEIEYEEEWEPAPREAALAR